MALNYAGYNPYPTPQFNTGVTYSPTNSFIWVQGEAGAKSYPVAPGNRIALFDSENPVVYIKSVDVREETPITLSISEQTFPYQLAEQLRLYLLL